MNSRPLLVWAVLCVLGGPVTGSARAAAAAMREYSRQVRPVLEEFCYDCHGGGETRGGVALDSLAPSNSPASRDVWWRVLKNLRCNLMPPAKKPQPTRQQKEVISHWIKQAVFESDPQNPDPGRVTLRRLNRVEYQNTIRDLLGVTFDAPGIFPPEDTGHGFDNLADVLTLSPMLLEKYVNAAEKIMAEAVPTGDGQPSTAERKQRLARFFPKPDPGAAAGRREYARQVLGEFARRAFRRPVDADTLDRLVALAESAYSQPDQSFEAGVAKAMVATLASPRFIFREEQALPAANARAYPLVDEYALASRLSYFIWSSMPDETLFQLAAAGQLRKQLPAQLARLLADPRAEALERNFVGQWLQARDIETVPIEGRSVLAREEKFNPEKEAQRRRLRELRKMPEGSLTPQQKEELGRLLTAFRSQRPPPGAELTDPLRQAMRQETESVFAYLLHENRSVLELLDSNYTFVNEPLARYYGLPNVTGLQMRLVHLPTNSPRGGILTEGTVLAVTSNPTRTSPVKRGVFILDNILGTPALPPPPNVPPLEAAVAGVTNRPPSLRETLAIHRQNPLCASCHDQMDPVGLALENFNALGQWREQEFGQPIDPSGQLITGESFANIRELKRILVERHAEDFYRTLTQKLLTYALGRSLNYYDVETVDQIVARLQRAGGKPSALFAGIVESAPFQKTRPLTQPTTAATLRQPL